MLQKTNDKALSIQATKDKRDEAILVNSGSSSSSGKVDRSIKNLSTIANLAQSKSGKLTKSKKLDLPNAKAHCATDFLLLKVKKTFIYLQKAFIKAPILTHFDLKRHILIETNALEYIISRVFSQQTLD